MTESDRDSLARFAREVTLMIGGVFARQGVDQATLYRVVTGIEHAYRRARNPLTPHPDVVRVLNLIDDKG